ncbi:MAG: homoserine kinase [Clostridia bacterium]|jgi:homoserine kinase|nr:homoserine kinase [Clostridia bacterium]MCI2000802.1 homoserine kinase [Clostridia bacterium]MCI2015406.1 homoserine kinase [Clostridia bacterium]
MKHIIVPATSANMGSGFDSIGIAFQKYNHLWFVEMESGAEILVNRKHDLKIPVDKTNLIYKTMANFFKMVGKPMPGVRLIQEDYIPHTRGLGSSAACIVAGLMAANDLSGCHYSREKLAQIAAKIEGHPDNSNPAILGGMVVGALDDKEMRHVKIDIPEYLSFAIMVPDFPLETSKSRGILPYTVLRKDAIFNSSRAALLVASMITGNIDNLKMAMDDRLHQPYRMSLVPGMTDIFEAADKFGAKGSYLSGAGPTLVSVITDDMADEFAIKMNTYLSSIPNEWHLEILKPDLEGARIVEG